jgi:signal peptidase II
MKNKYYLVTLLILVLDHAAKIIANAALIPPKSVSVIPGYLSFSRVYNSGVAFGLLDDADFFWKPYALAAMAVIAVAVIFVYSLRMPQNRKLLQFALAITMGGILGNFIDRIFRGYVIDFIEFHIHDFFYWPTFNLADTAITVGIALLLIDAVKSPAADNTAERSTVGSQT